MALAGCAGGTAGTTQSAIPADIGAIRRVVVTALRLETALDESVDTLFTEDAIIIANARLRAGFPRFAALGRVGQTRIEQVDVRLVDPASGWAVASYSWSNQDRTLTESGRATFLLVKLGRGWKIKHAHSSQLLPWL